MSAFLLAALRPLFCLALSRLPDPQAALLLPASCAFAVPDRVVVAGLASAAGRLSRCSGLALGNALFD